jgi:hypothetical protein
MNKSNVPRNKSQLIQIYRLNTYHFLERSDGLFDRQSAKPSNEFNNEILLRIEIWRVRLVFNSVDFLLNVSDVFRIKVVELPKMLHAD